MAIRHDRNYEEKKYNFFYKITNDFDDCYYYGIHSTNNMDDGYMGSGLRLHNAQKKHGIEHFIRTVLVFFDTRLEAAQYEFEFLTPEILSDPNCYNIAQGGGGGDTFSGMTDEEYESVCKKMSEAQKALGDNHPMKRSDVREKKSQEMKQYYIDNPEKRDEQSERQKQDYIDHPDRAKKHSEMMSGENNPMYGKSCKDFMTEDEIKEWGRKISEKNSGENNAMYGKSIKDFMSEEEFEIFRQNCSKSMKLLTWIHNDELKKDARKKGEELIEYLNNGWVEGRKYSTELTWIHNDELKKDKRKRGEELIEYLNNGWVEGRKYSISDKFKEKRGNAIGKYWYNNGVNQKQYFEGEEPEGWVRGTLKMSDEACAKISKSNKGKKRSDETRARLSNSKKGKRPVNNGIICKRIDESKLDEFFATHPDWKLGFIKKSA